MQVCRRRRFYEYQRCEGAVQMEALSVFARLAVSLPAGLRVGVRVVTGSSRVDGWEIR